MKIVSTKQQIDRTMMGVRAMIANRTRYTTTLFRDLQEFDNVYNQIQGVVGYLPDWVGEK